MDQKRWLAILVASVMAVMGYFGQIVVSSVVENSRTLERRGEKIVRVEADIRHHRELTSVEMSAVKAGLEAINAKHNELRVRVRSLEVHVTAPPPQLPMTPEGQERP